MSREPLSLGNSEGDLYICLLSPLLAAGVCEFQRFVSLHAHPCEFRFHTLMELVYKVLENFTEQVSFFVPGLM